MKVPNIITTDGVKRPVSEVPDKYLAEIFLFSDASEEDKDLVRLLQYAEPDADKNGEILRRCLEGKARLIPVYPGLNEKEPDGAKVVGSIMDGGLYMTHVH